MSSSSNNRNRFLAVVRGVVLAGIVVAAFWFGAKALREAPQNGSGGETSPAPGGSQGPPPASVFAGSVAEIRTRDTRRVTGDLRAVARAEVAARESGAVVEIFVDEGDTVKEGQVLSILDRRRIDAEIAEAKAAVTAAEVQVTRRKAESKRAATDFEMKSGLFEKRAVSRTEWLDSEREKLVTAAQVQEAEDQLNVAQSRLALLEVREEDLKIVAPFDGRVVERYIEPGEWLSPGTAVVSLVSDGEIEAWLDVPERFAASISMEPSALKAFIEPARITTPAKHVKRIAEVDMRSRLFQVVATLDDHGGNLIHGMSVSADLPLGDLESMLAVPVDAVVSTRLDDFVYRISPPADQANPLPNAERISVKVRFRRDGLAYLENAASLKPGDQVVVEGNERLMPGQPVIVSQDPNDKPPQSEVEAGIKP